MSKTYKVYYLDNNEIKKIYVFLGDRYTVTDDGDKVKIQDLFDSDPRNKVFENIFNENEIEEIIKSRDKIEIKFCKEQLHMDDSIEICKRKFIKEVDEDIAFEEIYMFSKKYETINAVDLYQKLTQNDKLVLTNVRLSQYLLNIGELDVDRLVEKDVYDFDDILSLNISDKKRLVNIPIGQQFTATENMYPYTVNPFDVDIYDPFLEKFAQNITTTTNNALLMTTGDIKDNIIYLCLAKDVVNNAKESGLSEETTLKIYFPLLYIANDITSLSQLIAKRQTLISNTKRKFSDKVVKQIEHVDLLYDIYNNRTSELKYKTKGIKKIQFTIHPTFSFKLPLDIVFKLIHVSNEIPFIKYNPSTRQEKIYKLHCEKVSVNRKKIPYLNKALIFKLSKKISRSPRTVGIYIEKLIGADKIPIICEFEGKGNITVNATFNQALNETAINELIRETINPIITTVQNFLEQSGYSINLFENFLAENVEIMDINYESIIEIDKPVNIKKIMGCVSTAFVVSESDFSKGIVMRFTRVSNFKEMEAMEAAVIGFIQKGVIDRNDIIEEIVEAFKISLEEATERLGEILSQLDFEKTTYKNRKLKVKSNPGFLTTINTVAYTKNIVINVEGINDINYLNTLPIYLDSVIRLTQDISTTQVSSSQINLICKGKTQHIEPITKDIVPIAQQELGPVNVQVNIVNEELVIAEKEIEEFSEEEQDDLFDKLLARRGDDEDDEEDEDGDLSGGAPKKKKVQIKESSSDNDLSSLNEDDSMSGSDNEKDEKKGKKGKDKMIVDITGKSLTHPNPFIERLEQRDPKLFLTRDEGRFKAYSRVCQSNIRRQPVILTDEEKERIDKEHKGSYSEAVKYGSNPDNKFWYICPRYWSLKYNVSLTEEQVKSGKYGKVIDRKAKTVPPDATIYEFATPEEHFNAKGEYIQHYPGFLKNTSHPENLCVPCCFSSWNKPEQIRRRNVCMNGEEDKPKKQKREIKKNKILEDGKESQDVEEKSIEEENVDDENVEEEKEELEIIPGKKTYKQDKTKLDDYIKGPEKFPLEAGRWGYLPLAIQKFLRTDNSKCYVSKTNTSLKPNHECLLRYGVENNNLQSFIACIASVYSEIINVPSVSISEMKNIIIEGIDLDDFITYQNGSLVEIFDNQDIDVVVKSYKKTDLFKTINIKNKTEIDFFKRVIAAYETFIGFIRDDTIQIDHKYLWDIVCKKNPKIFPDGLNLIVLEMPNNDITDNVNLLCPSNHYSSEIFNSNKPCLILLKIDEYYEPIYSLEIQETKGGTKWEIKRTFSFKNRSLMSNLRHTIEIIKTSYAKNCIPLNSLPKTVYEFKTNIIVSELKKHLDSIDYEITSQVMNFNNKIIGLMVENPDRDTCFVPCYPSGKLPEINIVYMNDDKLWRTFEDTFIFLKKLSKESNKKIPCLPKIKVLEDGLIIGLLTETNQFISIEEPEEDIIYNDMPTITDGSNYIIPDIVSTTSDDVDIERIHSINRIKLESNFYNVFRNTIRILLGQFRHRKMRESIEEIIENPYLLYKNKLKQISEKLIALTSRYISFAKYNNSVINKMTEVTNCLTNASECDSKQYCMKEEGSCRLRIPKNNLINGLDNESSYFVKMADELVRYNRIKSFIFEPKAFLPLSEVKYNLRDNEIILLQSLLTQDYFDDLVPMVENKYVANTSYDMAQPQINPRNIPYDNEIDILLNNKLKPMIMDELKCPTSGKLINGKLKALFPKNTVEITFETESNPLCTFEIIVQIIMDYNKDKEDVYVTKSSLKEDLIEFYKQYDEYYDVIADILTKQGKKFATQIFEVKQNMSDLILSPEYYATNLDIWALATKYNVPIIFLSGTSLIENDKDILVANSDGSDKYYFIKAPGINPSKIPLYKLIVIHEALLVPISSLSVQTQEKIRESEREGFTFDNFVKEKNLIERKQRKPVKKLKKFKIAQEENEPVVKKLKKKFKLVDEE
jgi:hypothetical protein